MTFLNPLAFALSAIAIPIVLLYILKLRREQRAVSSTFLWRRAVDDVQANVPWQRLRPSILLLLQLLALAALVLSLAQPAYTEAHSFNGDVIVIVDESFGMQAHDVAPSRFAVALSRAHSLVGDLAGGNVMSVIGMSNQPHLEIAGSDDHAAIDRAIDKLQVGLAAPNFSRAFSLAASLARSGAQTRVVVLTSRDSGITSLPIDVPFRVQVVFIGSRLHDLAITAFQASSRAGQNQALLRVSNFGSATASSDLNLYVNGQLADVRSLSLPSGQEQTLFWTALPAASRQLKAQIVQNDDVSVDKSAWTVVAQANVRRVLLVSRNDYFLQTALQLEPSVQLTVVQANAYQAPRPGSFDLVVFDGYLPAALPQIPTWLVAPPAQRIGSLQFGPRLTAGAVTAANAISAASPLLQFADLSDVHVAYARSIKLPDWLAPVAVSNGHPVVVAGDSGTTRLVLFSFSLQESDWPLRLSFPVMIQNVLNYLAPGLILGTTSVTAGQPLKLFPDPGTREVQITRPDGGVDRLVAPFVPYTNTAQTGIYTVRATRGGQLLASTQFSSNFFPSRIAPATGPAVKWYGHEQSGQTVHTFGISVSLAWTLFLAALLVLSAEWWFAFRR